MAKFYIIIFLFYEKKSLVSYILNLHEFKRKTTAAAQRNEKYHYICFVFI